MRLKTFDELTASDQSSCSDDDDSSGADDLTVGDVIGSECSDNVQKKLPRLVERHFPERIPPTEKKTRPTERCMVCYKSNRRKETLGAPNVKLPYVLKKVSRHCT